MLGMYNTPQFYNLKLFDLLFIVQHNLFYIQYILCKLGISSGGTLTASCLNVTPFRLSFLQKVELVSFLHMLRQVAIYVALHTLKSIPSNRLAKSILGGENVLALDIKALSIPRYVHSLEVQ